MLKHNMLTRLKQAYNCFMLFRRFVSALFQNVQRAVKSCNKCHSSGVHTIVG